MGLKTNKTIAILLVGIGAVCILAAAFLIRIWRFYIRNTKNKDMYQRRIGVNNTPPRGDPEAG